MRRIPVPSLIAAVLFVTIPAVGAEADLPFAVHRLSERVLHYVGLVEDLSLRSVEARLAHTLLRYAALQDGQLVVPRREWTTLDEMAVRLGTVRDVLSRLQERGLVRKLPSAKTSRPMTMTSLRPQMSDAMP